MKIVINACYGGFSISRACAEHMAATGHKGARAEIAEHDKTLAAFKRYKATGKLDPTQESRRALFDIDMKYGHQPKFYGYGYTDDGGNGYARDDPLLVSAVEALGDAANGDCARLRVVEVPDGVSWEISEYDGNEHVAERHRTWS